MIVVQDLPVDRLLVQGLSDENHFTTFSAVCDSLLAVAAVLSSRMSRHACAVALWLPMGSLS